MKAVVQRVTRAKVTVDAEIVGEIGPGMLVLAAVETGDTDADIAWMAAKLTTTRIFRNGEKYFDLDIKSAGLAPPLKPGMASPVSHTPLKPGMASPVSHKSEMASPVSHKSEMASPVPHKSEMASPVPHTSGMASMASPVPHAILLVSNFTIAAETSKGRRPSLNNAAPPEEGRAMFDKLVAAVRAEGVPVETGRFGAEMSVELLNDGPVTFILESRSSSL